MSKNCQITSKKPIVGNNVSHANNKVKRRFLPNLRKIKVYLPSEKKTIKIKVSCSGLRTLDKIGVENLIKTKKIKK